jgi:hypothetical protein
MPRLTQEQEDKLDSSDFAFPRQRKEPINDEEHIRAAIARFDQVEDVTNDERDEAWSRIVRAAKKHDIELDEKDWRELYRRNNRPVPRS